MLFDGPCPFVYFDNLAKTSLVRHGFSTRIGGVSKGFYQSMNLGFSLGDEHADVIENHHQISKAIGFDAAHIVFSKQVHGARVVCPSPEDRGKLFQGEPPFRDADGLAANTRNMVLTTFHADCVPLFFLDPVQRVIALSHAGWRGSVNGIAAETVRTMVDAFHASAQNILVGIGPSIGQCCFEVDRPVADAFTRRLEPACHRFYSGAADPVCQVVTRKESTDHKYLVDLWEANRLILLEAGIPPENIETAGLCTACNPHLFFSHRKMGKARGSMAAFLELL